MISNISILYKQFANRFIWFWDETQEDTTTSYMSGSGSNGYEEVPHNPQISRTEALPLGSI